MDQGPDQFHSNSALSHIIFRKTYPRNLIKISHILTNLNGLKSFGKSETNIYICYIGDKERFELIALTFGIAQIYLRA